MPLTNANCISDVSPFFVSDLFDERATTRFIATSWPIHGKWQQAAATRSASPPCGSKRPQEANCERGVGRQTAKAAESRLTAFALHAPFAAASDRKRCAAKGPDRPAMGLRRATAWAQQRAPTRTRKGEAHLGHTKLKGEGGEARPTGRPTKRRAPRRPKEGTHRQPGGRLRRGGHTTGRTGR